MSQITKIYAQEILDSRGLPTVKTTIELTSGVSESASVPAGTSKGMYEAVELRDKAQNRYGGYGVQNAIENINGMISQTLTSLRTEDQKKIDDSLIELDGTGIKKRLGANATLSVSLAAARAQAKEQNIPLYKHIRENIVSDSDEKYALPNLMVNVIEGGVHVKGGIDFQEFLVNPVGFRFFSESVENTKKLLKSLEKLLKQKKIKFTFGLEGGYAPALKNNAEALRIIKESIEVEELFQAGFELGLDVAASNLFKDNFYHIKDVDKPLSSREYIDFLARLTDEYKVFTLEDPLNEEDWDGWRQVIERLGKQTTIIGDDLTTTNEKRLDEALGKFLLGGVIVKPNQIGTLTETINFALKAKSAGSKIIVSHRSGETEDSFISDLAVALSASYIKIGVPVQKERIAKYTRLLEIEKELFEESR